MLQVGVLVAIVASGPTSDVAQLGLLGWALLRPLTALQALSLFLVVRNFNPGLAAHGALGGVLSWALPLIVSLRQLPLVTAQSLRVLGPLWLFCAVAALTSVLTSPAVTVSLMKAATLAIVAGGILIANQRLTSAETRVLGTWLRTLAVVVTGLSLATLVRPGIAHLPNSDLLNGVLSHSQALGAFLAPFAAASLAEWMLMRRSATPLRTAIWFGILGCTLLTASRTAVIATILGLLFSMLGGASADRRHAGAELRKALGMVLLLSMGLLILQFATGRVSSGVSEFVLKGGQGSVSEAFEASRGEKISSQLHNFATSPWVGHGFGVFAEGDPTPGVRTFMGIPVSAPVEKGVLPTAVLEETGLLGFLCLAVLIYALVAPVWRRAPHPIVAMLIACLFVNLGEAVLLSPGGMGLHIWLLIGWCVRAARLEPAPAGAVAAAAAAGAPRPRPFPNLLD
ncbi:MAG: hypothetical protein IT557_04690 [Alphaproteobacteria bacterium]|nr:hypothetical protein [Alphaproteobacteria bacterium]